MSVLSEFTDNALQAMRDTHTYRTMRCLETPEASLVKAKEANREVVLLASNSYLDLCNEPAFKQAAADAVLKWGTGSGGARLTTGNKTPHEELEAEIAHFKGEEATITFGTGYMANVGTISALASKQTFKAGSKRADGTLRETDETSECIVFSDELNHASIIDGIRLSKAKCFVYKHNDLTDLENKIKEAPQNTRKLIVTDAVFSMDGDLANLPELLRIARASHSLLMIDEAHATGVVGKTGRGLAEHYGCDHADVTLGTLSKAVGCEGGFVAGKQQLIDFLRNKARSFIFTTAMSPAMAQAALNGIKFIEAHPERVQQLQANVAFFCKALQDVGLNAPTVPSAIVPIIIGDEARTLEVSAKLLEMGFMIPAIRYPTVAKGEARLRASLMATHTKKELQAAANAIAQILKN